MHRNVEHGQGEEHREVLPSKVNTVFCIATHCICGLSKMRPLIPWP